MLSVIYGISPQQAQADPNPSPMFQDEVPWMPSSYEITVAGLPSKCPDPAFFKSGTRTIYSYIPGRANQDIAIFVAWYELDDKGNVVSDEPFTVAQGILKTGEIPSVFAKYPANAVGNVQVVMLVQSPDDGEWAYLGAGTYRLASASEKVPEPGECPVTQ